ncbi:hypothetical protein, partial [Petrocella sp. FN5]|uniref:hypothetical protein n=1 Tax=Petrocella sp. FN5 TaxID=3032002 RepID=UPI0023D999C0
MRKIIIMLNIIILVLSQLAYSSFQVQANTIPSFIDVYRPSLSFENALKKANDELYNIMGFEDYFVHAIYNPLSSNYIEVDANSEIWYEYGVFSKKELSGKYKFIKELEKFEDIGNYQWEFIGSNLYNVNVPNPYYTPDSIPKSQIMGRWKWVEDIETYKRSDNTAITVESGEYKDALTPT